MTPFAPTDPSAAADQFPWGPPTGGPSVEEERSGQGTGLGGEVSPNSGLGGGGAYQTPGRGRPSYNRYASPHAPTRERSNSYTQRRPAAQSANPALKPFSNFRQTRGASPYMGLFANDFGAYGGGATDNYNTLVRPRLEQRQRNSTVNSRLQGLQITAQGQAAAIQRIGRDSQGLQRTRNTGYYMNLGGYYPGLQK